MTKLCNIYSDVLEWPGTDLAQLRIPGPLHACLVANLLASDDAAAPVPRRTNDSWK